MKINKILKMSIYILSVFFSIGIILPIHAQDKIIPLWTDAIPGAIKAADYQEKEIYKEGKVQSISKVVTPTLSVFLAAEGNSNGSSVLILPGGGYSHLSIDKEGTKVAH